MADYPGAVPTEPSINTADMSAVTTHATDRGLQWGEIIAICQELGTTPSGSWSTVAERLQAVGSVCQVHDASQSIPDATVTTITFDSDEQLDPLGWHANGTNPTRVTPNIAGWYRVTTTACLVTVASSVQRILSRAAKNGAALLEAQHDNVLPTGVVSSQLATPATSILVQMNGTTDYFEMQVFQDDTGGTARAMESWMLVELVYPT